MALGDEGAAQEAEVVKEHMRVQRERMEAQEREGFFKTALIAYAANFYAHNHQIEPERVVAKSALLAELTWDAVVEYRKKYNANYQGGV